MAPVVNISTGGLVFRIAGGIFLILEGLSLCGFTGIPSAITGVFGVVAGVALLVGA